MAAKVAEKAIADSIAEAERAEQEAIIAARAARKADSIAAVKAAEEAEWKALTAAATADQVNTAGVSYRVQFLVSEKELPEGAKEFKGVTGYQVYHQGNDYRYTMGDEPSVKKAVTIQNQMRSKGFKDAFVIAFHNGKRISIQEAKELENE